MPLVNERGCPIYNQTGADSIQNFEIVLASLPPALRAAFEQERKERQQELDTHVTEHGYNS